MVVMVWIYILVFLIREASGGFCTEAYSCAQTCYSQNVFYVSCGVWGWSRCTRYSAISYTCTATCYRQVCCAGYDGSSCNTPICSPPCQNGGTCLSPNYCGCLTGFASPSCYDIDECSMGISGCEQVCSNTVGSSACSCKTGYTLAANNKSCEDVNECAFMNGECQDICTNTNGTFYCNCSNGGQLQPDGISCKHGMNNGITVFERNKLPRQLLPKACFTIMLAKNANQNNMEVYLSSTSQWYTLNSDRNVVYTHGIVFTKMNDGNNPLLPVSVRGLEVTFRAGKFKINYGVRYSSVEGMPITNNMTSLSCQPFPLVSGDIFEFVEANSFMKTLFLSLYPSLPDWLQFENTNDEILATQDLKSNLAYGEDVDDISWCSGAPVISDHLYAVFRFGTGFTMRVMEQFVTLPKPIDGKKFCLIVDIGHSPGGSVFLMIPEGSRGLLKKIDILRNLMKTLNLNIQPRGIGLSLTHGIRASYDTSSFELWNGDAMFKPRMPNVDLWIGGGFNKYDTYLTLDEEADIYIGVPNIQTFFPRMLQEEWTAILDVTKSFSPSLRFKMFGQEYSLTSQLVTTTVNAYLSFGGTDRVRCGDNSNPSGAFVSQTIEVNPFKGVPLLEEFIIYTQHRFYVFLDTEPVQKIVINLNKSFGVDIANIEVFLENIIHVIESSIDKTEIESLNLLREIMIDVRDTAVSLKELITGDFNDSLSGYFNDTIDVLNKIRTKFLQMEQIVNNLTDFTEFISIGMIENITDSLNLHTDLIRTNINSAYNTVSLAIANSTRNYTGFGFKFVADINIFMLGLHGMDIEFVYSEANLFRCSRFDKVRNLLKGQKALRFIARAYTDVAVPGLKDIPVLGKFLSVQVGFGIGGAFSVDSDEVIIHLESFANMIGIKRTIDLFITRRGLYFYLEGNVWDIFFAQIDVSAEIGNKWYNIIFRLHGRLVANARRKKRFYTDVFSSNNYLKAFKSATMTRQTQNNHKRTSLHDINKRQVQTVSTSFQSSYLDALIKAINYIGEEANLRLTQAQSLITEAQNGITKAQNWLESMQNNVRKANVIFDIAIAGLEKARQKLQEVKGPFEAAVKKLEEAQRKVDNLCKIRTCPTICIPGIRCRICRKRIWGIRIPFPCCSFTGCMIRFPNPFCEISNIACRIIRGIAYLALEAAKIFVRLPMIAFEIADAALTVAKFVVDKSRVMLIVAEGIFELAKIQLEFVKGVLEVAKGVLEAVKFVIKVAVKVLELIIEYGLKNIIDVRGCGFDIEISTTNLPVFDVFCEVNVFRLGWTKIYMTINFKNFLQSIWQAARATINNFINILGKLFGGRKKRDITFEASSKMHVLLRKIRETGITNETEMNWNETINIAEDILGFSGKNMTESQNRIQTFTEKCKIFRTIHGFMNDSFSSMEGVVNESKTYIDDINMVKEKLNELNETDNIAVNITVESAGINRDSAAADYNMTEEDLERTIMETKDAVANDSMMAEIKSAANESLMNLNAETNAVESIDYMSIWFTHMNNLTKKYFNESVCVSFIDCIFHGISSLYELYEYETADNVTEIRDIIADLEEILINTFQNKTTTILGAANVTKYVLKKLNRMAETNIYCSEPPHFISRPRNRTVLLGSNVTISCHAEGNPPPTYDWFVNGAHVPGKNAYELLLTNVSDIDNNTTVYCTARNLVTDVTSEVIHIFTVLADIDECGVANGNCEHVCENTIGSFECSCLPGYALMNDGKNCIDKNECIERNGGCQHFCDNKIGSFICSCKEGFELNQDGQSCNDVNECDYHNGGCTYKCENEIGSFKCLCNDGFKYQENGISCVDINECETENGGCLHTCVNEIGSFRCECKAGFELEEDAVSCTDVNECISDFEMCTHKCENEQGSFKCQCIDGFTLHEDGFSCIDTDECQSNNGGCAHVCVNEIGSFSCACNDGFTIQDDNVTCEDMNECNENNGGCAHTCLNEDGSFKCKCNNGFVLQNDSLSCKDVNECDNNNGGCAHVCVNEIGSFSCACNDGFTIQDDNVTCEDMNECNENNGGCAHTCLNEDGSFKCKCNNGFVLKNDSLSCKDVNECDYNNGGCAHLCLNVESTYRCQCHDGYILEEDGVSCKDFNECKEATDLCGGTCLNFNGTYACSCPAGFYLMDDGKSCQKIVEKTLSSVVRLTGITENPESRLQDLAEYKRMANTIEKALTNYIKNFTDSEFTVIVNQIRIGSIIADYTVVVQNSSATTKAIEDILNTIIDLANGASVLFDGRVVQAKTVLPENVTESCDILESIRGKCDDGFSCKVVENRPTCRLIQNDADGSSFSDNITVKIAVSVSTVAVVILLLLCVVLVRKNKQKRTVGSCIQPECTPVSEAEYPEMADSAAQPRFWRKRAEMFKMDDF